MDFRDTQGEAMTDTIDATVAAEAPAAEANGGSKAIHARPYPVEVDHSRDALLTAADGKSSISFEDYAIALADEIEKPAHERQRFTVGY